MINTALCIALTSLWRKGRMGQDRPLQPHGGPMIAMLELSDSQVVAEHLAGNERAFPEIDRRYRQRLTNFIHRTIGDWGRAEDLVQETFVKVANNLHRFDQSKKFGTWIYTIASNLASNELRDRSSVRRTSIILFQQLEAKQAPGSRPFEHPDAKNCTERVLRKKELNEAVRRAIRYIPSTFRRVFVLREIEGKSYEEISESLGIALGTTKSRLNRGRTFFAKSIKRMGVWE